MVFLGSVSCIISAEEKPSFGVTGGVGETESEGVTGETERDGVTGETERDGVTGETERDGVTGETERDGVTGETERDGVAGETERDTAGGIGERVVAVTGDKEEANESFQSLKSEGCGVPFIRFTSCRA